MTSEHQRIIEVLNRIEWIVRKIESSGLSGRQNRVDCQEDRIEWIVRKLAEEGTEKGELGEKGEKKVWRGVCAAFIRASKEVGVHKCITSKAEGCLAAAQSPYELLEMCPELFVVSCYTGSPFHSVYEMAPQIQGVFSWVGSSAAKKEDILPVKIAALYNMANEAQKIWDRIKELKPCPSWYCKMVYYQAGNWSAQEALEKSLTKEDWVWIRKNIEKEHCSEFMQSFLQRYDTELYTKLFELEVWYDKEFLAKIQEVAGKEVDVLNLAKPTIHPNHTQYLALFNALNEKGVENEALLKIPLCEWPRAAANALKHLAPGLHWKLISTKD